MTDRREGTETLERGPVSPWGYNAEEQWKMHGIGYIRFLLFLHEQGRPAKSNNPRGGFSLYRTIGFLHA